MGRERPRHPPGVWSASSANRKKGEQLAHPPHFGADGCKLIGHRQKALVPHVTNDGNGSSKEKNLDVQQQRPIGDIDEVIFEFGAGILFRLFLGLGRAIR